MTDDVSGLVRANTMGDRPEVDPTAYVDPSAQLIGRVRIGANVYVGPNAVLRADELDAGGTMASIEIGADSNIQDGVIMHALAGTRLTVGAQASVSHGCILHGPATVGAGSFIGFRSVVFRSTLGSGVYVGTGSVVEGVELASERLVPAGSVLTRPEQAEALEPTGSEQKAFQKSVIAANQTLAEGYRRRG